MRKAHKIELVCDFGQTKQNPVIKQKNNFDDGLRALKILLLNWVNSHSVDEKIAKSLQPLKSMKNWEYKYLNLEEKKGFEIKTSEQLYNIKQKRKLQRLQQ